MKDYIQKALLRALYEQGKVILYTWHHKTLFSPISLARVVRVLHGKGLLHLSDDHSRIELTTYGRWWLELHSSEVFATKEEETWKQVPKSMDVSGDVLFGEFFDSNDIQKLIQNTEEEGGRKEELAI